jgi:Siphovirus ReqiPepy6 Gp37-like protein
VELFKFNYTTDQTVLERGELINGYTSVMWVERYREPGEFQIVANFSSGLRDFLPAGTLISHADTTEVMIVENHEFGEAEEEELILTISGRSFESYLENRIVGTNLARADSSGFVEYTLTAAYTWTQAVTLINDHIRDTADADDALVNVVAVETVGGTGVSKKRVIPRGTVHEQLLELLAVNDLGIKTIRRNTFTGYGGVDTETRLVVHKGVDRSATIIFSSDYGDLDGIRYLFSGKKYKNAALVQSQYFQVVVDGTSTKYDRRFMYVDANDVDSKFDNPPGGADATDIIESLITRGEQKLRRQRRITITDADVSDVTNYRYRRDYNVGDIVTLDGRFSQAIKVRVIEFAEIEDENGESGHPTLELPEEEE